MKNQTTSQGINSSNESPLMWLKIAGYHHKHTTVKSVNQKIMKAGYYNTEALSWVKRNGNDLLNHFLNQVVSKTLKGIVQAKAITVAITVSLILMFVVTGAKAQHIDDPIMALDVTCNGGADGAIDISVSDGTPPYFYAWSNGSTNQDIAGIAAGTYTVTVTDNTGSTVSSAITITEPLAIIILDSITSVVCNGGSNGSIQLYVNGGSPPYTYNWSNSATTQNNSGLTAGTYYVTVTDANGCSATKSESLSNPVSDLIVSPNVTLCGGGCTTLNATSSNPNITYTWNPGTLTGASITVCPTVTTAYVVTAYDPITGCQETATVIVIVNPAAPIFIITPPVVLCGGGCTTLTVESPNDPNYNYTWNPGSLTGSSVTVCPTTTTTYTVVAFDPITGCQETATVTMYVTPSAPITISGPTVLCGGGCITLTASSANDPNYDYTWSPGVSGNLNTTVGSVVIACPSVTTTYTVTGVDQSTGCINTKTITVTVVPLPAPKILEGDTAVCNNSSGFLLHVIDTGAYAAGYPAGTTFEWIGFSGPTTDNTFFVNTPGAYSVIVTLPASLGSCSTTTLVINVNFIPCPPVVTVHFDNCSDNACLTVTGGCPPYYFAWCNGATSNDPCFASTFLLPCQTCPVTIMDACGNSVSVVVEKPTITLAATPATGPGICNGTITPNIACFGCAAGGLTYTWSNGQTIATATGLCCGATYTITVTNCYQNTWTCELTLPDCGCDTVCRDFNDNNKHGWAPDSDANNVTVNVANVGSQGGSNDYYILAIDGPGASALMTGTEFNTPWCCGEFCYDYKIFNDGFVTVQNVNPRLRIQATVGGQIKMFQFVFNATVNENTPWQRFCVPVSGPECALPPLSSVGTWIAVSSTVPPTLLSDWSSVVAGVQRISFPIDINGALGQETYGFDNVCFTPENYQVNAGQDITINQGQSVTLTAQGCSTTAIWHTISGGANLGWTGSTWTVTPTASTCYVVECGDPLCCGASDTVCVNVINLPVIHFFDGCDSTLCLNITGGTPPYTYYWHTSPIQTICPIIVAPCTNVLVTVTDANGSSVTVTHKKALITGVVTNSTCNPGNGGVVFDVSCVDPTCLPLTYAWRKNGSTAVIATTKNLTGVIAGTYCVTATDACGNEYYCCYDVKCVCIWDGCIKFNTTNASLTAVPFGAPAPGCSFTYFWTTNTGFTHKGNPWKVVPPFTNVTLKVVSCCGDTVTKTFKPLCNLVLTKTDPCCTDSDGVITVSNVMGGSQPCTGYSFEWQKSNAQGGPWVTILGATGYQLFNCQAGKWYRVIVRDCCGNSITAAPIKMGIKIPFVISNITSVASDCSNLLNLYNGSISFKVSASCAPVTYGYSYLPFSNCTCLPNGISYAQQPLNLVNNVATFNGLAPGIYIFFIFRCDSLYQFTDTVHFKKPTFKFEFTNCGATVCIVPTACCSVTYLWSNGATSGCINNLVPGATYTATVTDCEGQKVTRKIKAPKLTVQVTNANCGATNGSITLTIIGAITPFNFYVWDNDLVSGIISGNTITSGPRSPGQHCIKLYNLQGDLWECCYTITSSPAVSFVIAQSACRSNCITVLTGTPPYTYEWKACASGIVTSVSNCLDVCGCYNVTVKDKNGCTATLTYNISGVKITADGNCGLCADMCGGCAPYTYLWSNNASSQCIQCLASGTYTVTVFDCNGTSYSCSQSITVNPLSAQLMNVQQPAGVIDIKVSGGCLPYTCHYSINNVSPFVQPPPGTTNPTTFNIPNYTPNDWYTVTVNDACGSTVSTFQFFARNAQNGFEQSNALPIPMVLPNPNNGFFNVQFTDAWQNVSVGYQVIDMSGKLVLDGTIAVDGSRLFPIDLSTKPKGLYMIHYNALNKSWTDKIVIQ